MADLPVSLLPYTKIGSLFLENVTRFLSEYLTAPGYSSPLDIVERLGALSEPSRQCVMITPSSLPYHGPYYMGPRKILHLSYRVLPIYVDGQTDLSDTSQVRS